LSWDAVSSVLDTRFGELSAVRIGLSLVIGVAALALARTDAGPAPAVWTLLAIAAIGVIVTPVASGHASESGTVPFLADLAHVQAAAGGSADWRSSERSG
jgi:putative copper export protein